MPIVEVDGQEYEFPDDMSQDEIAAIMRKKHPRKGFWEGFKDDLLEEPKQIGTAILGGARMFPFAEKGSAGLLSAMRGTTYSEERERQKQILDPIAEARPTASFVGGGVSAVANPLNKIKYAGGLLGQAGLYAASESEVDPFEKPTEAAVDVLQGTAQNLALPAILKGGKIVGKVAGKPLADTKVGRLASEGARNVVDKLGGYVKPETLRVTEGLRKAAKEGKEILDLKQNIGVAKEFGGSKLPLAVLGGDELQGYGKIAASFTDNPAPQKEYLATINKLLGEKRTVGGIEKGATKGRMKEYVSSLYDEVKPIKVGTSYEQIAAPKATPAQLNQAIDEWGSLKTLATDLEKNVKEKASLAGKQGGIWRRKTITETAQDAKNLANVKGQLKAQEAKIKELESGIQLNKSIVTSGEDAMSQISKANNAKDFIYEAMKQNGYISSGGKLIKEPDMNLLKTARNMINKRYGSPEIQQERLDFAKKEIEQLSRGLFSKADRGEAAVRTIRGRAKDSARLAEKAIQKDRQGLESVLGQANLPKSAVDFLAQTGGLIPRMVRRVTAKDFASYLRNNPKARAEMSRLLLTTPSGKAFDEIMKTQPKLWNELLPRLLKGGAVFGSQQYYKESE